MASLQGMESDFTKKILREYLGAEPTVKDVLAMSKEMGGYPAKVYFGDSHIGSIDCTALAGTVLFRFIFSEGKEIEELY